MHHRTALSVMAVVSFLTSTAVFAEDRGSMEDQLACTPDVYRLCSQFIPDENNIVSCLKRNIATLSPACHKVFTPASPGTAQKKDDSEDSD